MCGRKFMKAIAPCVTAASTESGKPLVPDCGLAMRCSCGGTARARQADREIESEDREGESEQAANKIRALEEASKSRSECKAGEQVKR